MLSSLQSLPTSIPHPRSVRGIDARRDRDPRADGDRPARRVCPADRLLRLSRGLAGIRDVRKQSLPVVRRGFDHHADLCRRPRGPGRLQRPAISGARGFAGADGRVPAFLRRRFSSRLDRGSALDTRDDGLSRRHFRAHPDFPAARHSRGCRARRRHAAANCDPRHASERSQPVDARDRSRRSGDHRPVGADRRAHSRRLDRPCAGERGRGAARAREPRRQRSRRGLRRAAGAGAAGHLGRPVTRAWYRSASSSRSW